MHCLRLIARGKLRNAALFLVCQMLFLASSVQALSPSANGLKTMTNGVPMSGTTTDKNKNNNIQQQQQQQEKINSFDAFVQMRSGLKPEESKGVHSDVVFWTADGELYDSPSGDMIARVEGVETSRAVRLDDDAVRIFSRKLVWFLQPDSNEIMTEYKGQAVTPIRFDAQVFDLKRGITPDDNNLDTSAESNMDLTPILPFVVRSRRLVPCMPITPRLGGSADVLMYQVPLFIDIEIPAVAPNDKTRRYQAWEFYDYVLDINSETTPVLSWTRQGSNPPFTTSGNGVMHARGHRVGTFEELPQTTQAYVNKNDPLFQGPPQNMEEVDHLLGSGS